MSLLARKNRNPSRIMVWWCYGRRRSCFSNGEKMSLTVASNLAEFLTNHNFIYCKSGLKSFTRQRNFYLKLQKNMNWNCHSGWFSMWDDPKWPQFDPKGVTWFDPLWKPETVTHGRKKSRYMKKKQSKWRNWKRRKEQKNDWKKLPCIEKTSTKWGGFSKSYFKLAFWLVDTLQALIW